MTSSNVLFCPQPKGIQFTIKDDERNQKIFTFKEPDNFHKQIIQITKIIDKQFSI